MKKPNFFRDLQDGEQAEELVINTLKKLSPGSSFKRRKYKYYDFLSCREGKVSTFEVKYDMASSRTGNYFFELISNGSRHNLGAGLYCQANYLVLVLPTDGCITINILNLNKLKSIAINGLIEGKYKVRSVRFNKECKGLLIPLKDLREITVSRIIVKDEDVILVEGEIP